MGMYLPLRLLGCPYVMTSGPWERGNQGAAENQASLGLGGGTPRVTWKARLDVVAPKPWQPLSRTVRGG